MQSKYLRTEGIIKATQGQRRNEDEFWYFADRASQYIYLNINQLDALNFITSLFHASTCFEHHVLIVSRPKLYYTTSGIIKPIGGRASNWLILR